jgi:hypothetical protein
MEKLQVDLNDSSVDDSVSSEMSLSNVHISELTCVAKESFLSQSLVIRVGRCLSINNATDARHSCLLANLSQWADQR